MKEFKSMYSQIIDDIFPPVLTIILGDEKLVYEKKQWEINGESRGLRYGDNPDQPSALYRLKEGTIKLGGISWRSPQDATVSSLDEKHMLQAGKHPGKTNFTDVDNGINILSYLTEKPACVILKHNNPCGAAWASPDKGGLFTALKKAWNCDRIAAFGGAIVVNSPLDTDCASWIAANYAEVVAAPAYADNALEILKSRKNLRILELPGLAKLEKLADSSWLDIKSLADGGLIVQKSFLNRIRSDADFYPAAARLPDGKEVVAKAPSKSELEDLRFAWAVESGVSSNSVIFAKDGATIAIGTGEQDRVGCVELAIYKAYTKYADLLAYSSLGMSLYELREKSKTDQDLALKLKEIESETQINKGGLIGSRLVSDGFFPFRDGVDAAIAQGVSAIAQPGGSLRDYEAIIACNEAIPQVAMVFTGQRSFKH